MIERGGRAGEVAAEDALECLAKSRALQDAIRGVARLDFIIDGEASTCDGAFPYVMVSATVTDKKTPSLS